MQHTNSDFHLSKLDFRASDTQKTKTKHVLIIYYYRLIVYIQVFLIKAWC